MPELLGSEVKEVRSIEEVTIPAVSGVTLASGRAMEEKGYKNICN